jgi:Dyp-type peroxidase family
MAVNLSVKGIDVADASYQPMLANLQANILKSHARDFARLLCIQFGADDDSVKAWIKDFGLNRMQSALDQQKAIEERRKAKSRGDKFDGGLIANFFLTAEGYEELGFDAAGLKEQNNRIFLKGMKSDRSMRDLSDPPLDRWQPEYRANIDAMILLADDSKEKLDAEAAKVRASLGGIATVLVEEEGADLKDPIVPGGHEHFGYKDGISQPRYFKDDVGKTEKDNIDTDMQHWNPLQPLDIVLVKDPFTNKHDDNYGSFLVYRKLEQDVDGFNARVAELAKHLTLTSNQQSNGVTAEDYAGALVVGRFKDGTPLVISDIRLRRSPSPNDFDFKVLDQPGHLCPFHAHIRKTNPRGQGVLVPERFITRRGMPYGRPRTNDKKGLLFMCFQSSIKKQFTFIQNTWSNAPGFPPFRGHPGIDPLTGQGSKGEQHWPKRYGSEEEVGFDFAGFVQMKGGEYFFAPSLGFLRNL